MLSCRAMRGFTIMELLIAMFLSSLLISGVAALMGSSVAAYRQQLAHGQMEESGRFARGTLASHITQAGFHPRPWQGGLPALTAGSINGLGVAGDQLGLQRWSARNCYGNQNPVTGADGRPEFYLLQTDFRINPNDNLVMTCRYGPHASNLTTQVNNFGLAENVETLQALYAEDRDGDGIADGWVQAGAWTDESRVLAIKVAMLITSPKVSRGSAPRPITLLDETFAAPADGRLRRVVTLVAVIRGRLP
ncbi:MAG: PilW family protein [Lysobacterales bacterium]|jgi:prepilin-type N-terminal cleavage/methylation domain-containing protein